MICFKLPMFEKVQKNLPENKSCLNELKFLEVSQNPNKAKQILEFSAVYLLWTLEIFSDLQKRLSLFQIDFKLLRIWSYLFFILNVFRPLVETLQMTSWKGGSRRVIQMGMQKLIFMNSSNSMQCWSKSKKIKKQTSIIKCKKSLQNSLEKMTKKGWSEKL